jgi:hypothetical protein
MAFGQCPLTTDEENASLHAKSVEELIPKCRSHRCHFVDSDHDTDYLPGGCILLVVALLDSKRREQAE